MSHPNKEGQAVPHVTLRARENNDWLDINTADFFAGRTVVVFSLPGAFTPTCSSSHVPRYNELASTLKANGVDEIACVSVNDGFVMDAWKKDQQAENVTFLPDGNGAFTDGMGMLVDKEDLGFGKRSWRYSMLVKDGVVEKMFIEPDQPGDPFVNSDADTMLNFVNESATPPPVISLFTRSDCPFCSKAKSALQAAGLDYEEMVINRDCTTRSLRAVTAKESVPQVYVDGQHIGGSEALDAWLANR